MINTVRFNGQDYQILRPAHAGDQGFDANGGDQVIVKWGDGSERVLPLAENVATQDGKPVAAGSRPVGQPVIQPVTEAGKASDKTSAAQQTAGATRTRAGAASTTRHR